jgi:predicted MFS family arabinose efflux permease
MSTDAVAPGGRTDLREAPTRSAWAAVWALALTVTTLNASEMLPASLLTPMAASLDASEGLVGQSVTATALLAIATSLFIAPLTRRFDRRHVLLVVAAAQVLSNLVVALAPDAGVMLAARVLLGLTVGGVWGLSASLALRLVPSEGVPRALSIIFGGASVAMVAATPIGAFLGGIIGWRGVFFAATGPGCLPRARRHSQASAAPCACRAWPPECSG